VATDIHLDQCTCGMFLEIPHTCKADLFKGQRPPKKQNAKKEEGNAREVSLYLLGPKESSFRPLKLPESTISAKGYFLTFGQF
jgi:hypothetical protein